jgi:hypothetical protein
MRTILAFQKIAATSQETFDAIRARINDTSTTMGQYAQITELLDNKLKRVGASANAAFIALGNRVTSAFGVEDLVDGVTTKLGEIQAAIEGMTDAEFRSIVDSLGAGLIHAFSQAVQFLVQAFIAVAPLLAQIGFEAVKGVASGIMESDDLTMFRAEAASWSPEQRQAERERLSGVLGRDILDPDLMGAVVAGDHGSGFAHRVEALRDIASQRTKFDVLSGFAARRLQSAAGDAAFSLAASAVVGLVEQVVTETGAVEFSVSATGTATRPN